MNKRKRHYAAAAGNNELMVNKLNCSQVQIKPAQNLKKSNNSNTDSRPNDQNKPNKIDRLPVNQPTLQSPAIITNTRDLKLFQTGVRHTYTQTQLEVATNPNRIK